MEIENKVFLINCPNYLKNRFINILKLNITNNILISNIFIGSTMIDIYRFINRYRIRNKKYILYTIEPRHDINQNDIIYNGYKIYVMNCYTNGGGDTLHKFSFMPLSIINIINNEDIKIKFNKEKYNTNIIMLAGAHLQLMNDKNKFDLIKLRYKIATYGYEKKLLTLIGSGWKYKGILNTRNNINRVKEKYDIIKHYYFNICLENTNVKSYISEKIWESLLAGCLPIYYGNETIYTIFSKNSFIDVAKFNDIKDLYNFIKNMKYEEYYERIMKCFNDINNIFKDNINIIEEYNKILIDKYKKKINII